MSIYRGRTKNEIYLASLLYDAIEDADLRSVNILLADKRADPNLVLPKKRIAPFHLIIGNDDGKFALDVTRLILQHNGNPNLKADDGLTPMHIAAAWGRVDILQLLLDCGGDPESRDCTNRTPMHYALEENYPDCVNLLKRYLPDKISLLDSHNEDCKNYALTLDKILVNNGTTVGEYEIVNEYKTDSIDKKDLQKLQDLPQSDSKEYVINWFNNQLRNSIKLEMSSTNSGENSDNSAKESDEETPKYPNPKNICFRKVYRKKVKSPVKSNKTRDTTHTSAWSSFSDCIPGKQYSDESGIVTLANSQKQDSINFNRLSIALENVSKNFKDTSSDYMTCSTGSLPHFLEQNVFGVNDENLLTNDETNRSIKSQISTNCKSEGISSNDLSFISVSEIYKYVDQEEGIVLYERRFLKTPLSDGNQSISSHHSSLPETIDYDSSAIRRELTQLGYNPGPITVTTKRIYLKKLKQLRKQPVTIGNSETCTKVYSLELEKTLKCPDWIRNITLYKALDDAVVRQFGTPDPAKKWREGINKSSFTYLLLDPRVTNNLPSRADGLKPKELWETFLSAIFYVGKGKRSRPYSHLYDAVNLWNKGLRNSDSVKLQRILNIWEDNCGVVCLHLFQNTIPVEAYTREAAIINALKIENLCNAKGGNFYGIAATWTAKQKSMLGVYLLYKALTIFLNEGERQLCPTDID